MLAIIVGEWIVYMYLIVRMASAVSQQIFFLHLLANFKKPDLVFGKILNPLWQIFLLLGKYNCCKWPNNERQSSHAGHTA